MNGDAGLLFLRLSVGGMLFVVHGVHKVREGIAWLVDGTPWPLAREIAAMGTPLPHAVASFAALAQLVCPPLVMLGLRVRLNAVLLVLVLGGAVMQNVSADRDPQLAVLYQLTMVTLAIAGGGRFALDARRQNTKRHSVPT